jgi:AcrR family transcriptional regulator
VLLAILRPEYKRATYKISHKKKVGWGMKHNMKASTSDTKRRARAIRILDAAAELVLRWGYDKTTIDDIAKHAGVGKGTIYLHWKTREDLFETLLLHETIAIVETLIHSIQEEPEHILLHHIIRALFQLTEQRPLAKVLFTGVREILGDLTRYGINTAIRAQRLLMARDYLELLRKHGLIRSDMSLDAQLYALTVIVSGFFSSDPPLITEEQLTDAERAESLTLTVRNAFEPETLPSSAAIQEVAPQVILRFTQLCQTLQQRMQEELG